MIQRVQSLYLLATALLTASMLWLPLGSFLSGDLQFRLTAFGITQLENADGINVPTLFMGVLTILAALVPFVNIFLFRNRLLQIRLCFVEIVLLLGLQIFVAYYLFRFSSIAGYMPEHATKYAVADIFPIIGMILSWISFKYIARDEAMVRAVDRIR